MDCMITMYFDDGTTVDFPEDVWPDFKSGTWKSPYPNTEEDSIVFGYIEAISQSDSWLCHLMREKGEPVKVTIEL